MPRTEKVRVVTPEDLGGQNVIECYDGETCYLAVRQHGLGTSLVKIFSEYIKQSLESLNTEPFGLIEQGCSVCTGMLDTNGQPGRNERLHQNDFTPEGVLAYTGLVGCWVYSNPDYIYLTDGTACYKFVQVGIMVPMDTPRMCLGGPANYTFAQSCFTGGKNEKIILEPDTTLDQMAARFGLTYPLI